MHSSGVKVKAVDRYISAEVDGEVGRRIVGSFCKEAALCPACSGVHQVRKKAIDEEAFVASAAIKVRTVGRSCYRTMQGQVFVALKNHEFGELENVLVVPGSLSELGANEFDPTGFGSGTGNRERSGAWEEGVLVGKATKESALGVFGVSDDEIKMCREAIGLKF